ncbi:hypothetical protein BH23BAC4_BH23BAC4_16330 [soil metagenome]
MPPFANLLALFAAPLLMLGGLAAMAPERVVLFPEDPAPGHTGGFGEPTCTACHFDAPVNDPAGSLDILDLPKRIGPNEPVEFFVTLRHPQLVMAGFQLTIRDGEGRQAGTIEPVDERAARTEGAGGVEYLHHSAQGNTPDSNEGARWRVRWTPDRAGHVVAHVAAIAANGDASEFGDFVFADSLQIRVK